MSLALAIAKREDSNLLGSLNEEYLKNFLRELYAEYRAEIDKLKSGKYSKGNISELQNRLNYISGLKALAECINEDLRDVYTSLYKEFVYIYIHVDSEVDLNSLNFNKINHLLHKLDVIYNKLNIEKSIEFYYNKTIPVY